MISKGDNVICVNSDRLNKLSLNKIYKVLQVNDITAMIHVINDNGVRDCYYQYRFELDIRSIRKHKLKKIYEKER